MAAEIPNHVVHRRRFANLDVVSRPCAIHLLIAFAMYRSFALPLAVGFASMFAVFATPVRAAESLPDPRILAAAPFEFRADHRIFSRMPDVPSDSRIFAPSRGHLWDGNSQFSQMRIDNPTRL
jgi:hypothetical protein